MVLVLFVHTCRVYLCLAPGAFLYEAAGQRGSHRVALEEATDSVAETQSNQLLRKKRNIKQVIKTFRLRNRLSFDIDMDI